jgi:hypothetical protein
MKGVKAPYNPSVGDGRRYEEGKMKGVKAPYNPPVGDERRSER